MRISPLLAILVALISPLPSPRAEDKPSATAVKNVDVAAAAQLVDGKTAVVLDVRTPREFSEGHIAGARNMDFKAPDFLDQVAKLDKSQPYLVQCAVGGRSAAAAAKMAGIGFRVVYNLNGGIKAWEQAGKPVTK